MKKLTCTVAFLILFTSLLSAQQQDDSLFLQPGKFVDSDNPKIIAKASELIKGCNNEAEKAKNIFEFVRDSYSENIIYTFTASEVLDSGGNSCRQRSVLLAALCRAAGIPARLHWQKVIINNYRFEDGRVDDIVFIHGLTGIKLNGKWHLYEAVGNNAKWRAWVQKEEDNTIEFNTDTDCLFNNTDKVHTETIPLYFTDHFPEVWERIYSDEIGLSN